VNARTHNCQQGTKTLGIKMLKFLAKSVANAAAIEKLKHADEKINDNFERWQKVRKLLGQADKKKSASYTPLPTKLSSLEKNTSPSLLTEALRSQEIHMYCKDAIKRIIHAIEDNTPSFIAGEIVDGIVGRALKVAQSNSINATLRRRVFTNSRKTWRERAIVLYFVQCSGAGATILAYELVPCYCPTIFTLIFIF
jgi:hypothetical protein